MNAQANLDHKYGSVRVIPASFGEWKISTFEVTEEQEKHSRMRCAVQGCSEDALVKGQYTRLIKGGHVVMSNTPMELNSNRIAYDNATGNVLIAGLGMGMILDAILSKPDVKSVTVVEEDGQLIKNVGALYADHPKVKIIHGDITEYQPESDEYYDFIWFDIWTFIESTNIEVMFGLALTFADKCDKMAFWSINMLEDWQIDDDIDEMLCEIKSMDSYIE